MNSLDDKVSEIFAAVCSIQATVAGANDTGTPIPVLYEKKILFLNNITNFILGSESEVASLLRIADLVINELVSISTAIDDTDTTTEASAASAAIVKIADAATTKPTTGVVIEATPTVPVLVTSVEFESDASATAEEATVHGADEQQRKLKRQRSGILQKALPCFLQDPIVTPEARCRGNGGMC
jgi:hypothetical protein